MILQEYIFTGVEEIGSHGRAVEQTPQVFFFLFFCGVGVCFVEQTPQVQSPFPTCWLELDCQLRL